jgi:hypothetical protein
MPRSVTGHDKENKWKKSLLRWLPMANGRQSRLNTCGAKKQGRFTN